MATKLQKSGFQTWLVDPLRPTNTGINHRAYRYDPDRVTRLVPLAIGVALLIVSAVGWWIEPEQFYFSYLVGWTFCLTLSLGALFFVMIHHITRAHWGIVVRRIPEALAWGFPLLAVLSIPILIGMHDLYHWTHAELYTPGDAHFDEIVAGKRPYLNEWFFVARLVVYFVLWSLIAYKLYRLSIRQDVDPDPEIPFRQRKVSAWGIPVFAVTVAFASYDLLMSLDPHWYSTIFGVYIFAGAFWSANALIILAARLLQRGGGALRRIVTVAHYHDLGKWLFAFTVFWAYIAFSQYMLIWYANIPEETVWYRFRLSDGWEFHSAALLIAHFIIPFLVLLPRSSKRMLPLLTVMAVWALIMQWFDLHWIAMPVLHETEAGFHWLDFSCWLGLFGLYIGVFLFRLERHSLVPQHDPYLRRSLQFENV